VSPSFGTRTSLGYEPYDARLCCLGKSLVRSHTTHVSHGTLWGRKPGSWLIDEMIRF
jgi:hypothetical protein